MNHGRRSNNQIKVSSARFPSYTILEEESFLSYLGCTAAIFFFKRKKKGHLNLKVYGKQCIHVLK